MPTKRDYYEVLEVPRNASEEEIRKAFRRKAMEYHPDRNRDLNAADKFKEISEAYHILSDPEQRKRYDLFGHGGVGVQAGAGRGFDGFDTFGGFGDIFDAFFGGVGSTRTNAGPIRGADLYVTITLDFGEAVFGAEKEISAERNDRCQRCGGKGGEGGTGSQQCANCRGMGQVRRAQQSVFGQFVHVVTCPACGGRGQRVPNPCHACRGSGLQCTQRHLTVAVPAGVDEGTQLRLASEGDLGREGGLPGDLYVTLHVRQHDLFRRDGDDILLDLPINVAQAALGTTVEVPTVDGSDTLKIPAGIQSGAEIRLKGKGVRRLQSNGRGDQLVKVTVVTPQHLDQRSRRLLEELAAALESPTLATGGSQKRGRGRASDRLTGSDKA